MKDKKNSIKIEINYPSRKIMTHEKKKKKSYRIIRFCRDPIVPGIFPENPQPTKVLVTLNINKKTLLL